MANGELRRHIGLGHGIALYVSAILGAGVLVLPGQVASMAGPASLVSWLAAGLLGVPLATMFLALARRYPEAGGVASYVRAGFGTWLGGVAGWMFFAACAIGQTIVPLTGGYYVARVVGGDEHLRAMVATGVALLILGAATATNAAGARVGARTQLAMAAVVAVALALTVAVALPRMQLARLRPFAPHGVAPIGAGVIILFFAFAGWEAIAHLAGEFRRPERDLPRAVTASIAIVTALYLGVAAAVVLTGTYGSPEADRVAISSILESALGPAAGVAAAALAVAICFGTCNAFLAGVSRLACSLAQDGWLPTPVGFVTRGGTPVGGVLAVAGIAMAGLGVAAWRGWGTETLVVVPSTLVVAVYTLAAGSALRVLRGWSRAAGLVTLLATLCVAPTAAAHLAIPLVVAAIAVGLRLALYRRPTRRATAHPAPTAHTEIP